MRVSTSFLFQQSVQSMNTRQSELSALVAKLSSGRNTLRPSEDPFAASRALELEQNFARTQQFQTNADFADARLSQEESTLRAASDLLQRLHDLAIQGNNGALGNVDRESIAHEVRERFGELVELANTVDANGDFLFAGFRGDTRPVEETSIGQQRFARYLGDSGERFVQVSESRQLQEGDPGDRLFFGVASASGLRTAPQLANTGNAQAVPAYVFDPTLATGDTYRLQFNAGGTYDIVNETQAVNVATGVTYVDGDVVEFDGIRTAVGGTPAAGDVFRISPAARQDLFTTVSKFAATLETNVVDDAGRAQVGAALGQSIEDLDLAIEHLTGYRTRIGGRLNALDAQRDENAAFSLQTETALSTLRDLDYAAAISRLEQNLLALQAAQQSFARIEGISLFNFLR